MTTDIILMPGECYIGDENYRIRTLLGSCVSITLWHPKMKIGAMSHFLLPLRGDKTVLELDGRYADEAMWLLLKDLLSMNVPPTQCEAKIFGGGNMFPQQTRSERFNVGQRNGEAARSLLRAYKIPIVSENLFGTGHRKIIFEISSGAVWTRLVEPSPLPDIKKNI
ncbi:MAG: chemotaxis protein CheD [Pseudomonadota bacterium]